MDLVQALDQTRKLLDRRDGEAERFDELGTAIDGALARYRETRRGDVAYSEQGADRIDRTGPAATEQKEQVQAALIAFSQRPTPEHADLARQALSDLDAAMR